MHVRVGFRAAVEAIGEHHDRIVIVVYGGFDSNRYAIALARKLAEISPGNLNKCLFKCLFAPGGAEAVSMAVRLARLATGRFKTISLWDSFHGATLDAISLGGEALFAAAQIL